MQMRGHKVPKETNMNIDESREVASKSCAASSNDAVAAALIYVGDCIREAKAADWEASLTPAERRRATAPFSPGTCSICGRQH